MRVEHEPLPSVNEEGRRATRAAWWERVEGGGTTAVEDRRRGARDGRVIDEASPKAWERGEWEVEDIRHARKTHRSAGGWSGETHGWEYLVAWKGQEWWQDTWVPYTHMSKRSKQDKEALQTAQNKRQLPATFMGWLEMRKGKEAAEAKKACQEGKDAGLADAWREFERYARMVGQRGSTAANMTEYTQEEGRRNHRRNPSRAARVT